VTFPRLTFWCVGILKVDFPHALPPCLASATLTFASNFKTSSLFTDGPAASSTARLIFPSPSMRTQRASACFPCSRTMEKCGALLVRLTTFTYNPVSHALLGHCYLMQDELQKAYSAYQHTLYSLPNPVNQEVRSPSPSYQCRRNIACSIPKRPVTPCFH
jgi:hypothetical protein